MSFTSIYFSASIRKAQFRYQASLIQKTICEVKTLPSDDTSHVESRGGKTWRSLYHVFFFFFKSIEPFNFYFYLFIFIFGCVVSLFLCEGFLQLRRAGATLHHGARDSQYRGLSCCGAQAPDAQAQQLWLTSPAAPRHVGSSQTRARTHVPCVGRQTLNHCATREALSCLLSYCEPLNWSPGCQHSHLQVPSGLCQGDLSKLPISNMAFLSLVGFIFHFDSYFHS